MKNTEEKEYEPFSEEWEKEMMKFNKKLLIEFLKKALKENIELKKESHL
jgi:hypothetical protein